MCEHARKHILPLRYVVLVLAAFFLGGCLRLYAADLQTQLKDLGLKDLIQPGQSITLLPNGQVLLLGGFDPHSTPLAKAVLVDSSGQVTELAASLQVPRAGHTATLLPDGTVFIFGGLGADGQIVQQAEQFDPSTGVFSSLEDVLAVPRAFHTATVLTDGTVLLAGGVMAGSEFPDDVQLWDFHTRHALSHHALLINPRQGHTATLLADSTVRVSGGTDRFGRPVTVDEIYDPVTRRFRYAGQGSEPDSAVALRIAASIPDDGATGVSIQPLLSIRFSRLVNVTSVDSNSFTLLGPDQKPIAATVTPAENGRLVFVNPQTPLETGTNYVLRIRHVLDSAHFPGDRLPDSSISFQTEGEPSEFGIDGQGPPSATTAWQQLRPLQAPPNVTALAGQVLKLTGWPLEHVTLQMDGKEARTDSTGRFLLLGLTPGRHVLWIDATTANRPQASYGVYEVGVTIQPNKTTVLNYTIWMTPLDMAHAVTIPSPTTAETVITNPALPGLELHLPAGTVITDCYGKVVHQISITRIPLDKPPFPLPAGVQVPVYFTIQPGGAYIKVLNPGDGPAGARLIYPNGFNLRPGTIFDFWNYDADVRGWYVYGYGKVSADALSVIPDPGVVIYEFTGAMASGAGGGPQGCLQGNKKVACPEGADPVSLNTGQFIYDKTDLVLPDTMPLSFGRTYISGDSLTRSFGVGFTDTYDIFLIGDTNPYTFQELILTDGNRVRFDRISQGTSWKDAVYVHATSPGSLFYGARLYMLPDAQHWQMALKDGTKLLFPEASTSTNPWCQALVQITDRYGNVVSLTRTGKNNTPTGCNLTQVSSPNGRYITFTHDTQGRITQAQDNSGRTVTYTYDAAGRLSTVTDVANGVTTYTYNDQNQMTTIKDARSIVYLTNQYDPASGRVTQQTQADSGTYLFNYTPTANTSQIHFYQTGGVPGSTGGVDYLVQSGCWGPNGYSRSVSTCLSGYLPLVSQVDVTDPRGYVRELKFGPTGYLTSDTHALGQPEQQTVTYSYFSDNTLQSVTDALGRVTSFTYDANGNTTSVTRLSGTPNAVTANFTYEPVFNHLTSVTDPLNHPTNFGYDASGNMISATDPLNHQSTFAYNSFGQMISATDALNNTVQFGYTGGNLTSVIDPMGNQSTNAYDAVGRQTSATDPQGNISSTQYNNLNLVTQVSDFAGNNTTLAYDPNGNLLSLTDALNHATNWTYDNMDRVITRKDALQRQASYTYDLNGNLGSRTDRKNQVTSFTYDALNRPKMIGYNTVVNGGVTTYESTTSYTYDGGNRLTQAVDSAGGTITKAYDNLDRLTTETTPQGSITYGYDNAGRRTSMTVAGQSQLSYSYDNANRLTQIAQGSTNIGFSYDNKNRRTALTLPNGVSLTYSFDNNSRVTGITYNFGTSTLGNLAYSYDQLGRRTQVGGSFARTNLPPAVTATAYDAANQLTNWNGTAISYDANGNMLSDGTNAFTWNARNQVASLNTVSLQYDAGGRRIKNAAGTSFLFDGGNATQELSGSTVTANTLTGGTDETFQRTDSNGTVVPLVDVLGSTIGLVNSSGSIATTYTYDPFGNTTTAGAVSSNRSQYTGRENEGNGLYYYRARYYSPVLHRFVSQDPLAILGGGVNVYTYAGNSPTNFRDPSGKNPGCLAMGVINTIPYNIKVLIQSIWGRKAYYYGGWEGVGRVLEGNAQAFVDGCEFGIAGKLLAAAEAGEVIANAEEEAAEAEEALEQCLACFPAGVLIHTKRGPLAIEKIKIGDEVLSRTESGKLEYKKVVALTQPHLDELLDMHVEGEQQPLRPTAKHPFWVKRGDKKGKWVPAGQIQVSDRVLTAKGEWHKITGVSPLEGQQTVYNFEVEGNHDYFVGSIGLLVHNGCSAELARNLEEAGFKRGAGEVAHHIVAENAEAAADAKAVLEMEGIPINSAVNGVFIPEQYHWFIHTDEYYEAVNEAVVNAAPGTAAAVLRAIGSQIMRGVFPY